MIEKTREDRQNYEQKNLLSKLETLENKLSQPYNFPPPGPPPGFRSPIKGIRRYPEFKKSTQNSPEPY